MFESIGKDIAYAWRSMRRSPGFFAVAVLSLGLGVGVNTAMFSLVDALLFRPLPVQAPDTLVDLFSTGGDGDEYATSSYADYVDVKAQNTVFSEMTAYSPMMAPLALGDLSRVALGQIVTGNHFTLLAVRYRDLQAAVHPDRFVNATDAEKRIAMTRTVEINDAYTILKDPVRRAMYLLSLKGIDGLDEKNTAMPMDFLMEQVEWREALADARCEGDAR